MKVIKVKNVETFVAQLNSKKTDIDYSIVSSIIRDIKKNGDQAVKKYEKKFSKAFIKNIKISQTEINSALKSLSKSQLDAINESKSRLLKTESAIKSILKNKTIINNGVKISKKFIPLDSVGCYIPGGLARYPSSVIMSVIPAKIAGVKRIVVVSPPNSSGKIDPMTISAAKICGANEIYKTGGVQSIAALAYGTKSIPKVDKIVGPGGAFVTEAKFQVSKNISIDMLAGPTELGIIVDNSTNPTYAALDLISQAEHSNDTFCYVITTSEKIAKQINSILDKIISQIDRKDIVKSSLSKNGFIAICKNNADLISLANQMAPEHLQIMTRNSEKLASKITSPGLILTGNDSPSSASDYILGSNHILPTNGFGKVRGSLSVLDFMKLNTQVRTSKEGLKKISKSMEILTNSEGLSNHFKAVRGRLK
jgi:histidinol dehydrogenase